MYSIVTPRVRPLIGAYTWTIFSLPGVFRASSSRRLLGRILRAPSSCSQRLRGSREQATRDEKEHVAGAHSNDPQHNRYWPNVLCPTLIGRTARVPLLYSPSPSNEATSDKCALAPYKPSTADAVTFRCSLMHSKTCGRSLSTSYPARFRAGST